MSSITGNVFLLYSISLIKSCLFSSPYTIALYVLLVWIGKYGKQIVESLKDLISSILNAYEMLILNMQFCPRINLEIAEMKPQLTLTLVWLSYVHKSSNWGMRISKENTGLCTISMKHVFVQVTWVITVHRNISHKGIMALAFMVWLLSSLFSYML